MSKIPLSNIEFVNPNWCLSKQWQELCDFCKKLEKAGQVRRFAITIKFGARLLLVLQVWGKAPIRPFVLCQPIGVFPQIWWSIVALSSRFKVQNSRLDLGNVLLTSHKLKRMPHKHIQKLIDICGRANLSGKSLFGHLFTVSGLGTWLWSPLLVLLPRVTAAQFLIYRGRRSKYKQEK